MKETEREQSGGCLLYDQTIINCTLNTLNTLSTLNALNTSNHGSGREFVKKKTQKRVENMLDIWIFRVVGTEELGVFVSGTWRPCIFQLG
jgi:hypothetical protein